jgi:outer membrane receptor protein involved in Fe transport
MSTFRFTLACFVALIAGLPSPQAGADGPAANAKKTAIDEGEDPGAQYVTEVRGTRPATAASARTIRGEEVMTRARSTPYDFLRLVPNLVVGLHEGGGKAPQYLMRGVDGDHGADLAMYFDGIPINEVSHVHGLGYLDVHFMIPELIERIDAQKGMYDAENGSFNTVGAIRLHSRSSLPRNEVSYTFGSFESHRALGLFSPKLGANAETLFAVEGYGQNGFTQSGQSKRYNVFSKVRFKLDLGTHLDLMGLSYGADWNAPALVPEREERAGRLGRFGAFNPFDGGTSARHLLAVTFERSKSEGALRAQTYLMMRRLALYHDFTGFASDPVNGDQFVQNESRTTFGGEATYSFSRRLGRVRFHTKLGAQWRYDDITPSLWNTTARERRSIVYSRQMQQTNFGGFAKETIDIGKLFTLELGARYDMLYYDVVDPQEDLSTLATRTSGTRQATILNPKASLVFKPWSSLHFFANAGSGFRASDARAAVLSVFPGLARSTGAEGGFRTWLWDRRIEVAGTGWWMDSDRDVVFVADAGANEEVGASRRYGVELEVRARLLPWMWLDFDFSATRARFKEDSGAGLFVPRAPAILATGGVQARHPSGLFGSLRARHVGDYALVEDNARRSQAYTVADLVLGYETKRFQVALNIQNLFNTAWRDSEYYYESVANPMREATPVHDVHFRPGEPFLIQGNVKLFF